MLTELGEIDGTDLNPRRAARPPALALMYHCSRGRFGPSGQRACGSCSLLSLRSRPGSFATGGVSARRARTQPVDSVPIPLSCLQAAPRPLRATLSPFPSITCANSPTPAQNPKRPLDKHPSIIHTFRRHARRRVHPPLLRRGRRSTRAKPARLRLRTRTPRLPRGGGASCRRGGRGSGLSCRRFLLFRSAFRTPHSAIGHRR